MAGGGGASGGGDGHGRSVDSRCRPRRGRSGPRWIRRPSAGPHDRSRGGIIARRPVAGWFWGSSASAHETGGVILRAARGLIVFASSVLLVMLVSATAAVAQPSGTAPTTGALFTPPEVGDVLTDQPGVWTGIAPITVTIQWLDCDSTVANCNPVTANGN